MHGVPGMFDLFSRAQEIGAHAKMHAQADRIDELEKLTQDPTFDRHKANFKIRLQHLRSDYTKYMLSVVNPAFDKHRQQISNNIQMNIGECRKDAWDNRDKFVDIPEAEGDPEQGN